MDLKKLNDNRLIDFWREGDERAFKELFSRYFKRLYYYSLKIVRNEEMAEDVVMDVMLNIWQKRHLLQTDRSISSYLYKSVKNKTVDQLRKQVLNFVSLDEISTDQINEYYVSYSMSDDSVRQLEIQNAYAFGLTKLSRRKQMIFKMSREDGLSYQEIANKLQLSKNTVENHMVAALRVLKTYVKFY